MTTQAWDAELLSARPRDFRGPRVRVAWPRWLRHRLVRTDIESGLTAYQAIAAFRHVTLPACEARSAASAIHRDWLDLQRERLDAVVGWMAVVAIHILVALALGGVIDAAIPATWWSPP